MKTRGCKSAQVYYKGQAVSPAQEIASIYKNSDGITVNFVGIGAGSYPNCKEEKGRLIIKNGQECDEIKLIWE